MSSNFYHIDNLGEVFSITIERGFRQELFDNYDCDSNGDLIQAIVKYLIRINDFDGSELEFDSDTDIFAVYCEDEKTINGLAEILERNMYNDRVIDDAMKSPEVREEMGLEQSHTDSETETFFDKFNGLFRHD